MDNSDRRNPSRGQGASLWKNKNMYRGAGPEWRKSETPLGMCREFQMKGQCKYGRRCKFSHDRSRKESDAPSPPPRMPRAEETDEQRQSKADYHSWRRLLKTPPLSIYTKAVQELWDGALAILTGGEREWKQMLPRDLDDEEYYGRDHIRTLLNLRTRSEDHSGFIQIVRSFLLVITHAALLDCLSVDTFVGGLYNFISGTNGSRAVPFFQHLCEALVNGHLTSMSPADVAIRETTLVAASTAIRELIKRESRSRFNDDLPTLIDSVENAAQIVAEDSHAPFVTIVLRHMCEVRAVVSRAKGLLIQEEEPLETFPTTTATSRYPQTLIMPRDRHDNDNIDMTKIKIFPTRKEILSDEPEFLPSTDLDMPHFLTNPAERHLDTHFRLLRHDTFGELKDLLGGLMQAVKDDPTSPKLSFGDFRANQYAGAYISYISFDNRRALEMHLTFTQPGAVRSKSASERRKWWEESRRLIEGVLLSFISFQHDEVHHLFFIVTQKNTDTGKDHGLSKKDYQGTITVKLASQDQIEVESALRLSTDRT
ncbi:hypothetical protein PV08_10042 [Exophiala spinifera]|uniref:C3H1-type domain-containing protein n=1 Tax=Exophiala spinifera TaxID=91928 RepID=A0A0D2AVI7_9EURO|nr:uncharacterized protein PV08_10042 [Exophiala spinifera]KIW10743.1 hypothetical protein PV08_10042 [Exophiala spinifera]